MKFYVTEDDKLYQFNPQTGVYKLRNTVERIDKRIAPTEFSKLKKREIKRDEFSRLMNIYFKNVKHKWVFEGKKYRKLPNFESNTYSYSDNYKLGTDVPYHDINLKGKSYYYLKNMLLVYHWGRLYYHTVSYNGYPQGQLITIDEKHEFVQWCRLRNCAPVFCIDDKRII